MILEKLLLQRTPRLKHMAYHLVKDSLAHYLINTVIDAPQIYSCFTIGKLNENVVPLPSALFSAHILPP
jgi:hypothetical protein